MFEKQPQQSVVALDTRDFSRLGHIPYRAAKVMGLGFILGLLLMGLHHALYQTLTVEPADNALLQLGEIRAGTAIAFFSKLCLATGTGVAYDQWMWVDLQAKPHEIRSLDAMFSILGNAFETLAMRMWIRGPVLTILAAVTWCVVVAVDDVGHSANGYS